MVTILFSAALLVSALVATTSTATTTYLPLNANCAPAGSVCEPNLACAGTPEKMKCVYTMKEGKQCDIDPYWVCASGLDCIENICRYPTEPLGASCEASGARCAEGLLCSGPSGSRVCSRPLPVGSTCGGDDAPKNSVCDLKLVCEGGVCKHPAEERCMEPGSICVDGTVCAGNDRFKKCVVPMGEGKACGGDPFWVCASGFDCLDGKCVRKKVPLGGSCQESGALCEEKLQCAGPDDARVCVKELPVGEQCEHEPFWVCRKDLVCESNICKLPKEADCSADGSICVNGTKCFGKNSSKKCVEPVLENGSCEQDDAFSVCAEGLECMSGICSQPKVRLGGSCQDSGSVCEDKLQCAGPEDARVCVKSLRVGEQCEHEPFWVCRKDLICEKNICKLPKNADCSADGSICVEGTECFGNGMVKKCVQRVTEHGSCDVDSPFTLCEEGLKCISNTCRKPKVPLGGSCQETGMVCEDKLQCAGPVDARVCVKSLSVGEQCEHEPFWVCRKDLSCEENVCKLPNGADCSTEGSVCLKDSVCAGQGSSKKCVAPIEEGKACTSDDPLSVCKGALVCEGNICSAPKVPLGGSCSAAGAVCDNGLACAGPDDAKVCVKTMPIGEQCMIEPFWVCAPRLKCENNVCRIPRGGNCVSNESSCVSGAACVAVSNAEKKCLRIVKHGSSCSASSLNVCAKGLACVKNICRSPIIQRGGNCTPKGSVCVTGTVCVGPSTRKRCVMPMSVGKKCNTDPYWVCARGLTCERNICKLPRGGNCSSKGSVCVSSTVCAGNSGRKRCVIPMTEGKKCHTDPYWVCQRGLTCLHNVCRKLGSIRQYQVCTGRESHCVAGTKCVGYSRKKWCYAPRQAGHYCRLPFRTCVRGHSCVHNRCRKIIGRGGNCSSWKVACMTGTVCVGPWGRRRCVKPMGLGQKCGTDPYWVCANGLKCMYNVCKRW